MADETNESTAVLPVDRRPPPAPSTLPTLTDSGYLPTEEELRAAQRYANGMVLSGVVPDTFRYSKDVLGEPGENRAILHRKGDINNALVLMGILKCMELGVAPQTGMAGLYVINNRFSVFGDLAASLVQRTGQVAKHVDQRIGPQFDPNTPPGQWPDEYGWEVRYWRKGQEEPYIGRFTVRDAKRAGLWMNTSKDPWIKYPDRMLFNRARAFCLRDGFADALMGLTIAEEQMELMPPVEEPTEQRLIASSLIDDEPETSGPPAPEEPRHEPQEEQEDAPAATSGPPEPEIASGEADSQPSGENEGEPKPVIQGPNGEILDDSKLI